ncbi:MAG: lysine exporter LysO family protein [Emergencia sp.]|nr:lysine exporter LysO family protein [Emergencia sp.]
MGDLLLYVILAIIGYMIAARLVKNKEKLSFIGPVQTMAIVVLVFSMGARMGSNEEVIHNLNKIGLYALILAVVIIFFSMSAVSLVRKFILKLDKYGHPKTESTEEANKTEEILQEETSSGSSMTLIIVVTVCLGLIFGYLMIQKGIFAYESFDAFAGEVIRVGLCVLLFLVGMDLGVENTFIEDIKSVGFKILALPAAVVVGSLFGAVICALFIPLSVREAMAVAAGFGWYSLAPAIIMEEGFVMASAISFMHNVFRETLGLLLIPMVAKKIGYIEAIGMPGSGASDVCLPLIVKSTRSGIAIYSFVTGILVSLMVPILVPVLIG